MNKRTESHHKIDILDKFNLSQKHTTTAVTFEFICQKPLISGISQPDTISWSQSKDNTSLSRLRASLSSLYWELIPLQPTSLSLSSSSITFIQALFLWLPNSIVFLLPQSFSFWPISFADSALLSLLLNLAKHFSSPGVAPFGKIFAFLYHI